MWYFIRLITAVDWCKYQIYERNHVKYYVPIFRYNQSELNESKFWRTVVSNKIILNLHFNRIYESLVKLLIKSR